MSYLPVEDLEKVINAFIYYLFSFTYVTTGGDICKVGYQYIIYTVDVLYDPNPSEVGTLCKTY